MELGADSMRQGWICGVEDNHCGGGAGLCGARMGLRMGAVREQAPWLCPTKGPCEAVPHCWVLLCSFLGLGVL